MANELDGFSKRWAGLTYPQKNLLCDYALGKTVYSYAEMLREARDVWQTQPKCRVFFKGFEWLNEDQEHPVLVQMSRDYVGSLDEAVHVEQLATDGDQQEMVYVQTLCFVITGKDLPTANTMTAARLVYNATADQRCHAAMLALGYVEE